MKTLLKRIGLFLLVITVLLSISATVFAFNWSMKVGDHFSMLFSDTPYVSSDTSVIEIQSLGGSRYEAVAVAPGTATVTGGTWMGRAHEDYIFIVTAPADYQPPAATTPSAQPEATTPSAQPEASTPETPTLGTTLPNPPAATTPPPNVTVPGSTAAQPAQSSNNIDPFAHMHQNLTTGMKSGLGIFTVTTIVGCCIFGLVITFFILALVYRSRAKHFSKIAMGPKVLPPLRTGPKTVTTPVAAHDYCPKCGLPFGNGAFCGTCGTPKAAKNIYYFQIDGKMYGPEFEAMVNDWLAENPYIYNCKLHVTTDWTSFALDFTRKYFITKASIEFNVSGNPLPYRHGVAFLYKKHNFRSGSGEELVDAWLENNRDCKAISWENRKINHWQDNAMTYTLHYNIVLFQKPVQ